MGECGEMNRLTSDNITLLACSPEFVEVGDIINIKWNVNRDCICVLEIDNGFSKWSDNSIPTQGCKKIRIKRIDKIIRVTIKIYNNISNASKSITIEKQNPAKNNSMKIVSIILQNPYRILGVFSNSSKRDIVANKGKLSAFLKVGRIIEFPLDLKAILPPVQRSMDLLLQAESSLSLAKDQLRYVLFWFVKQTSIDDIAFNYLKAGDVDTAISIWEKKTSFSSLQNIMVCALIKEDYQRAFSNANILFDEYLQNYVDLLSNQITISTTDLIHLFLDCLFEEKGMNHSMFLNLVDNNLWNDYIKAKQVQPLIDSISKEIEKAVSVNRKDYKARYLAGCILKKNTTNLIKQLKQLLPTTDMQYQILIDKLGLEILQCGIDYFNASEEPDAAMKAMELQKYALSIVVGKAAKDRCKENVDILEGIIEDMPPMEVFEEDKLIKEELVRYTKLPETIINAENLLRKVKPALQRVRNKLGYNNNYYLKMSTAIIAAALNSIIDEVNKVQDNLGGYIPEYKKREILRDKFRSAWSVMVLMDSFDLESEFKQNRYIPNKNILKDLCEKMGVSIHVQQPTNQSGSSRSTSRSNTSASKNSTSSTSSSNSSSDNNWGCIITGIIIFIIIIIIANS